MGKKKKNEGGGGGGHDTAGGLRWLLTYADMITLLLGVFIILCSAHREDSKKQDEIATAFEEVFSVVKGGGAGKVLTGKGGAGALPSRETIEGIKYPASTEGFRRKLKRTIGEEIKKGRASIITTRKGIIVRFSESAFFDKGSAKLRADAIPVLSNIADLLETIPNYISIEGHTDPTPPAEGGHFSSNWELSTARATAVVHFLCEHARKNGMSEFALKQYQKRLQAVGYAQFRPAFPDNPYDERNRRIDIVILEGKAPEFELFLD